MVTARIWEWVNSSILAWRIPWTEEPGRLLSMGSQESDTHVLPSLWWHELCCDLVDLKNIHNLKVMFYSAEILRPKELKGLSVTDTHVSTTVLLVPAVELPWQWDHEIPEWEWDLSCSSLDLQCLSWCVFGGSGAERCVPTSHIKLGGSLSPPPLV